jgi:predicted amidohydrolase
VLLRARAIETQSYVIAAAQCGVHSEGRASYGHSIIVDPWGEVIAKLDDPDEGVGIAVAEIDLRGLEEIRAKMPIETHRRGLGDRTAFPVTIAEM